jgi:hypothetical protein
MNETNRVGCCYFGGHDVIWHVIRSYLFDIFVQLIGCERGWIADAEFRRRSAIQCSHEGQTAALFKRIIGLPFEEPNWPYRECCHCADFWFGTLPFHAR